MEGGLPPGWISQVDPNTGATFYVNTATNQTTWERPAPASAPPPQFGETQGQTYAAPPSYQGEGQGTAASVGGLMNMNFMGAQRLGISWDNNTVTEVVPGTQAAQQNVQVGWQIVSVDNDSMWMQSNRLLTRARQPGQFSIVFNTVPAPNYRVLNFKTGVGIGVDFNQTNGMVTSCRAGSQAQTMGVQPGWTMLSVNNEKWSNQGLINASSNTAVPSCTILFKMGGGVAAPMQAGMPMAGQQMGIGPGGQQGYWHPVRYCGPISVIIGIFVLPCICCCPVDSRNVWVAAGQQPPPNDGCC